MRLGRGIRMAGQAWAAARSEHVGTGQHVLRFHVQDRHVAHFPRHDAVHGLPTAATRLRLSGVALSLSTIRSIGWSGPAVSRATPDQIEALAPRQARSRSHRTHRPPPRWQLHAPVPAIPGRPLLHLDERLETLRPCELVLEHTPRQGEVVPVHNFNMGTVLRFGCAREDAGSRAQPRF